MLRTERELADADHKAAVATLADSEAAAATCSAADVLTTDLAVRAAKRELIEAADELTSIDETIKRLEVVIREREPKPPTRDWRIPH